MISAIILAAGSSKRMGKANKLLLPFRETTLIGQVFEQVLAAQPYEIIVVLGHEEKLVRGHFISTSLNAGDRLNDRDRLNENGRFDKLNDRSDKLNDRSDKLNAGFVRFVVNPDFETGMTSSIQAGIAAASPEAEGYMICLSDLPFIQPEEYLRIMVGFRRNYVRDKSCIVLPFYKNKRGNPVIFSSFYKSKILAHNQPEGCREILQANKQHLVKVKMETDHVLRDLDTPEQYGMTGEADHS